jgi:hypothetical protein
MRLFALILIAGIGLSSVSASVAAPRDTSRFTDIAASCPTMKGYPDCRPSGREGRHIYSIRRLV